MEVGLCRQMGEENNSGAKKEVKVSDQLTDEQEDNLVKWFAVNHLQIRINTGKTNKACRYLYPLLLVANNHKAIAD
jgi:hypothetical protein